MAITIDGTGSISGISAGGLPDGSITSDDLASSVYSSFSAKDGTHTTGSITSGTTALTVASGTGISNGDYVVGEGITPGTTVSSGGGTTSITLSANANATLSSDPVAFYSATKLLTPGLVGGQLCRAWVNFNGTGTVAIRASYNVSSITDNGTGVYVANFTTALPDANYSVVCLCGVIGTGAGSGSVQMFSTNSGGSLTDAAPTTTAVAFTTFTYVGAYADNARISVVVFR